MSDPPQDINPEPTAATPIPLSPTALLGGRYQLDGQIARGGAATVYRARDTVLNRDVAVKVFRDGGGSQDVQRFEREAQLLAGLNHPGLVTVFDAGTDTELTLEPQSYLVMELVAGNTLAERLAGGPLSAAHTGELGSQLAAALTYIHSASIVHRDLKPANILLTPNESDASVAAKLTDFGIARAIDSDRMTMHGFTVGTANYLSPEQALGSDIGPASDVYSLGLVLLECRTGAMAFPGNGVAAAGARLSGDPDIPAWVGANWTELISAMTRRAPSERPSAADVMRELDRMHPVGVNASTQLMPAVLAAPHAPSSARRKISPLVAAGALACVLIAAIVLSLVARGPVATSGVPQTTRTTPSSTSHTSNSVAVVAKSSTRASTSPVKSTTRSSVVPVVASKTPPGKAKHSGPEPKPKR